MGRVELHPAYVWDCPECGVENFSRAVVWEGSEEDRQHMREEYGIESWETGEFQTQPDEVTCRECKKDFETKTWGSEDE